MKNLTQAEKALILPHAYLGQVPHPADTPQGDLLLELSYKHARRGSESHPGSDAGSLLVMHEILTTGGFVPSGLPTALQFADPALAAIAYDQELAELKFKLDELQWTAEYAHEYCKGIRWAEMQFSRWQKEK